MFATGYQRRPAEEKVEAARLSWLPTSWLPEQFECQVTILNICLMLLVVLHSSLSWHRFRARGGRNEFFSSDSIWCPVPA